MATHDVPSKAFNFAILDDHKDDDHGSESSLHEQESALTKISGNRNKGTGSDPDALALRLERLHLHSSNARSDETGDDGHWMTVNRSRGLKPRPQVSASTFDKIPEDVKAPKQVNKREASAQALKENPLAKQYEQLHQPDWMQLAKHRAGKYEWVVSLPVRAKGASSEGTATRERSSTEGSSGSSKSAKRVHFGCTMVRADGQSELVRRTRSNSGNTYTLIATPIDSDDKPSAEHMESVSGDFVKTANPSIAKADEVKSLHGVIEEAKSFNNSMMAQFQDELVSQAAQSLDGATEVDSLAVSVGSEHKDLLDLCDDTSAQAAPDNLQGTRGDNAFDESLCFPVEPSFVTEKYDNTITLSMRASPASSFRASPSPSPRIEDSIEALDEFEEQFEAISEVTQLDQFSRPKPSLIVAEKATTTQARQPSVLPSVAATTTPGRSEKYTGSTTTANKRLSISKPSSLQPPKPVTRSVRRPTISNFELPGDAVARRLKERREARLSMSSATTQASRLPSASPSKASTTPKPPTRPNFELPGEAISRRKREEREAKLKAQEEEDRKRREFKARPVRSSISSGNLSYRETAASRARQKVIKTTTTQTTTPPSNKRRSLAAGAATYSGRPSISRPALNLGSGPASASKAATLRGRPSFSNVSHEKVIHKRPYAVPMENPTDKEYELMRLEHEVKWEEDTREAAAFAREQMAERGLSFDEEAPLEEREAVIVEEARIMAEELKRRWVAMWPLTKAIRDASASEARVRRMGEAVKA